MLDASEIFFSAFEPVQKNRFVCYMDGFPTYLVKGMSAIGFSQEKIKLNHINVYRMIKGKTTWNDVTFTLFDAIEPSTAQIVMDWVRLHHESVTGRDGYSDFYKRDLTFNVVDPLGGLVREWILKGALITEANMGDFSFDDESVANEITMTVTFDYAILNF